MSISSSATSSPAARRPAANHSGASWLPFVKSASGRPGCADAREDLDRARLDVHLVAGPVDERPVDVEDEPLGVVKAHGATPRPARRSRPAARCTGRAAATPREERRNRAARLARRAPRRPAPRASSGGAAAPRRRSPAGSARGRAWSGSRSRSSSTPGRESTRSATSGSTGRGRLAVVAEEVADRLDRDVRPALRVDHVPHRLRRDHLRDRRDDDRVAHLGAHAADLLEDRRRRARRGAARRASASSSRPCRRRAGGGSRSRRTPAARPSGRPFSAPSRRKCSAIAASASRSSRCEKPSASRSRRVVSAAGFDVPRASGADRRVQHPEAGASALQVGERREPDRAVAVQLDRLAARRGGEEVRGELPHRVRREQAAGSFR